MASDDFEFLRPEPGLPNSTALAIWFGDQLLRRFFSNQRTREGDITMATCFTRFLRDESGMVITAELIMIVTIAVISLSAGWGAVAAMLSEELEDVANSIGSLDQSYSYNGISAPGHASCSGSGFNDSRNFVNVSTSSNFNAGSNFDASVAGGGFAQQSLALVETQVEIAATPEIAADPFVLVEESFCVNAQIDTAQLELLVSLNIVEICEDGSVLLLQEDLIEIRPDGSIVILYEAVRAERAELRDGGGRVRAGAVLVPDAAQPEQDETRDERDVIREKIETVRKRATGQSSANSDQLRQENARLRELIERLRGETQPR
jgi:hypothetical protein